MKLSGNGKDILALLIHQRRKKIQVTIKLILDLFKFTVLLLLLITPVIVRAQDSVSLRILTLKDVYRLALANSYQLKISSNGLAQARQQLEITKSARLPSISTDLEYGYLSNAESWNPSFADHQTVPIPHHFTAFSTRATEIIFKGGEIQNIVKKNNISGIRRGAFRRKKCRRC